MSTPVYVASTTPVSAPAMPAACPAIRRPSDGSTTSPPGPQRIETSTLGVKSASVHAPTDIALWILKTRNMFRKRAGRPRSEMRSAGDTIAPAPATHRASRTSVGSAPVSAPTAAITAAMPAAPPAKKYAGTSHVQTGAFSSGWS